jgi:hypothetical protein
LSSPSGATALPPRGSPPKPQFRTGVLWGVLALLLLIGILGAAWFVYGLTTLLGSRELLWGLPELIGGGFVATLMLLLIAGVLYRVDRVRGVPQREVRLFE